MNQRTGIAIIATLALALALPASAAAGNLFLQLDGSYVTSTSDSQMKGSANTFEVQSWRWSVANSGERPNFTDLTVTKMMDRNSPQLAQDVASGRKINRAVLTIRTLGSRPVTLAKYCFNDVTLTSFRSGSTASGSGTYPIDEVSLAYGSYAMSASLISPAGAITGKVVKGWNLLANVSDVVPALAGC